MNPAVMHQDAPWFSTSIHKNRPAFAASLKALFTFMLVNLYRVESLHPFSSTAVLPLLTLNNIQHSKRKTRENFILPKYDPNLDGTL